MLRDAIAEADSAFMIFIGVFRLGGETTFSLLWDLLGASLFVFAVRVVNGETMSRSLEVSIAENAPCAKFADLPAYNDLVVNPQRHSSRRTMCGAVNFLTMPVGVIHRFRRCAA